MTPTEDIAEMVRKALEEALRNRGQANVLIAGRTGVGKSTLINAVFQGNLAETGQGRPVTRSTREYTKEGLPLSVWDTRGFELSAFKESIAELERLIAERSRDRDPNKHIHAAWLCVHEDGRRVEDAEIELHSALSRQMPVLGVITKARADQGFRAEVQRLLPLASNVIRVRALAEEFDEGHTLPPMGLQELVEATGQVLPEGARRAFVAAQKASIQLKKNAGHKIVVGSATAAAAAGASPIPFSDAVILVPIQVAMLAGISSVFGLELSTAFLMTLVTSAAGGTGATFAGRAIVANLLKLIPGGGTLVGGVISATTAAVLTTTLGELYIATLAAVLSKSGGEAPAPSAIVDEFRRRLGASGAS
jgi:uncharacterized protein (DUF697 family)/GTP-binding protein EngB required for normal cell division